MSLLTVQQHRQLLQNGHEANRYKNHFPVLKLHMPALRCAWLLAWLDPEDGDTAYGLCDPGICPPRLGYICLSGLAEMNDALGFAVERDPHFTARYPISVYARAAQKVGHFTEAASLLTASLQAAKPTPARVVRLQP